MSQATGSKPATGWQLLLLWTGSTIIFALTISLQAWLGSPESLGQVISTFAIPVGEAIFLLVGFAPWCRWRAGLKRLGVIMGKFFVAFWRTVLFGLGTFLLTMPVAAQLTAPGGPLLLSGSIGVGAALSAVPYRRLYVRSLYVAAGRKPPRKLDSARLAQLEAELGLEPLEREAPEKPPAQASYDEIIADLVFPGSVSGGTAPPEVIRAWERMAAGTAASARSDKRLLDSLPSGSEWGMPAFSYPVREADVINADRVKALMDQALSATRREPLILPQSPSVTGAWRAPESVMSTPAEIWGGALSLGGGAFAVSPEAAQELLNQQILRCFSIPSASMETAQLAQVQYLRAARFTAWAKLKDLADRAAAEENRVFTESEQHAWDMLNDYIARLDAVLKETLG